MSGTRLLVWAGSKTPHSSGTVLTFGDQATDFDIFIQDDLARVRFEFPRDSSGTRAEYHSSPAQDTPTGRQPPTVHLRFFNVRPNGVFADGPIHLGTVGPFGLWLAYEVAPALGSRDVKKITYTFWEGPTQPGDGLLIGKYRG